MRRYYNFSWGLIFRVIRFSFAILLINASCAIPANSGIITAQLSYKLEDIYLSKKNGTTSVRMVNSKEHHDKKNNVLPAQDFFVLLPPSGVVTGINIASYKSSVLPKNTMTSIKHLLHKNAAKSKTYKIEYLGEKWVNGKNLGLFRVYPLHYDKRTKELVLFTKLNISIRYKASKRRRL